MRRPTLALAAAVFGTALAATSVSAQQAVPVPLPSLIGGDPAPTSTSTTTTGDAGAATAPAPEADQATDPAVGTNPARSARTLVRNGWDYITYQEYQRALVFFKEADARKAELTNAERLKLKQGIDKAQKALQAIAKGASSPPAYAVSDKKGAGQLAKAGPADSAQLVDGGPINRMKEVDIKVPSTLQMAMKQKDTVELPPLVDERPRTDDQISLASTNDQQPPSAGQPIPVPDPSNEPLPEPSTAPVGDPSAAMPAPAASPDQPPLPALPTLPTAADLATPTADAAASLPLPRIPTDAAQEPILPPSLTEQPVQAPAVETPAPAEQPAQAPVPVEQPAQAPVPVEQPAQAPVRQPISPAAPEMESLPPLPPTLDDPPAAEAPGTPSALAGSVSEEAPALPPTTVTEGATPPAVPDPSETSPGYRPDTLIPERRLPVAPGSSISPELQREVEMMARRQDEEMKQKQATEPPPGTPNEEALPEATGLPGTSAATRLEIARAPSSTEARPIKAIPVPEEFVPLPKREWNPNRKFWAAAATCHMPLYFQDASLERYGYSMEQRIGPVGRFFSYPIDDPRQSKQRNQILQPFSSIGLFAIQIGLLPWNLIMDPPWEAEYDLGYYRPGDRVPTDVFYLPLTGIGPPLHGRNYGGRHAPRGVALPASRWQQQP